MNAFQRSALGSSTWLIAVSFLLIGVQSPEAVGQERQRDEVSWVNPKLPAGPGLTHKVLRSKSLQHDVGYVVWTPPGFDDRGDTRYPVIYFLHGMGGNESGDSAGFSGLVARGIQAGVIPDAICVFPNGGRSGYRGPVEEMITNELVPLIDQDYPTDRSPTSRIVAGFSMGGAGAVRLSLLHPEMFTAAGSWGGGMWRDSELLIEAVEKRQDVLQKNQYAALLVNGDQDRPDAFDELVEAFEKSDVLCRVSVLKETPHNLGLYYERGGEAMQRFLGEQLRRKPTESDKP